MRPQVKPFEQPEKLLDSMEKIKQTVTNQLMNLYGFPECFQRN